MKLMQFLKNVGTTAFGVVVGGWALGLFLDEAGQGKYGNTMKNLAIKATNGFGK